MNNLNTVLPSFFLSFYKKMMKNEKMLNVYFKRPCERSLGADYSPSWSLLVGLCYLLADAIT